MDNDMDILIDDDLLPLLHLLLPLLDLLLPLLDLLLPLLDLLLPLLDLLLPLLDLDLVEHCNKEKRRTKQDYGSVHIIHLLDI